MNKNNYFLSIKELFIPIITLKKHISYIDYHNIDYKRLMKEHLIVIDDIMTITIDRNEANSFFHFNNALHEYVSIGITINKSKEWVETIDDEEITLAHITVKSSNDIRKFPVKNKK